MSDVKHIPAKLFRDLAEFKVSTYCDVLPPNITFEDLFQPNVWAHFGGAKGNSKFKKGDVVRAIAEDGSFDLDLTVVDVNVGSVTMRIRPFYGDLSGAEALKEAQKVADTKPGVVALGRDGKPVVRVDHLPATGWRVIGVEGEVSRGHESRAAATEAMNEYLKKARLVMPEPEPKAEPKAKAETKAA